MMLLRLAPLVLPFVDPELYGNGGWSSPKFPEAELEPREVVERGVEPESERGVKPLDPVPGPMLARLWSCLAEVGPIATPTPTAPSSRDRPGASTAADRPLGLAYGAGGAGGSLPAPPLPLPSPSPPHHSDEATLDEDDGVSAALDSAARPPSGRPFWDLFWDPLWMPVRLLWRPVSCTWLTDARRALGGPLGPPPPPPFMSNGVPLGAATRPPVGLLRAIAPPWDDWCVVTNMSIDSSRMLSMCRSKGDASATTPPWALRRLLPSR